MLFNKADARMRCVLLGPAMDDRDAVRALVVKATERVFKNAVPARAAGGRASGEARRRKRDASVALDAATAITSLPHGRVAGDGSGAPPTRPAFPEAYNALAEMPPLCAGV